MKSVNVTVVGRDEEGNINGSASAMGYTEDDGITVKLPLGYLPNLSTTNPQDITVTVYQPPVEFTAETAEVEFTSEEQVATFR